jgi:hypothetical protein
VTMMVMGDGVRGEKGMRLICTLRHHKGACWRYHSLSNCYRPFAISSTRWCCCGWWRRVTRRSWPLEFSMHPLIVTSSRLFRCHSHVVWQKTQRNPDQHLCEIAC